MALTKVCSAAESNAESMARASFSARGKASVHWRKGTCGNTSSTRCAAVTAARFAVHEGQMLRPLQEKPTRTSTSHESQLTRTKPKRRSPQPR